MQKQREWKILKDFKLTFPNCDKGIELLCQSTIFIEKTRYRDVILKLSKTHYRLTKTFLYEVTNNLVKVNDKNWRIRFRDIYNKEFKDDKKDDKKGSEKKKKDNIQHLIKKEHQTKKLDKKEEELEFDNDTVELADSSSSSVVEEDGDDEQNGQEQENEQEQDEESEDFVL